MISKSLYASYQFFSARDLARTVPAFVRGVRIRAAAHRPRLEHGPLVRRARFHDETGIAWCGGTRDCFRTTIGTVQTTDRPRAVAGIERWASRLRAAPDEIIEIFEPREINIVVTSGETQGTWRMFGCKYQKAVSVDAWR